MDCAPLLLSMPLNPTGGCFSYLACFQPMAAELTIFRNGCKECKTLPLHVLTSQKKIESIFCGGKRTCFDTPPHRMFSAASQSVQAPFQAARLHFLELQGSVLAGNMQQGQVFFVKLASCIAVFGGAWHVTVQ